ncbi:hypothetical protein DQ392_17070 [Streptomyces reniochalinae]|uniref:Uncharacterized protein n=1 Tax=Streptomyces reniochalinae TaxID=2250578 RepID=A0A367EIP0_9ACTN|nr:hypothetical protein DQ392_17070 [Streptomyces reniochalinae]
MGGEAAASQLYPSGSVNGPAVLPSTTRSDPVPSAATPRSSAGPVSFFAEVATFQSVPSGAWTTPP